MTIRGVRPTAKKEAVSAVERALVVSRAPTAAAVPALALAMEKATLTAAPSRWRRVLMSVMAVMLTDPYDTLARLETPVLNALCISTVEAKVAPVTPLKDAE